METVTGSVLEGDWLSAHRRVAAPRDELGLAILWSLAEPHRTGEVAILSGTSVLGRGEAEADEARVAFGRQRPGRSEAGAPLAGPRLSRRQARFTVADGALDLERLGRCAMRIDDRAVDSGRLTPGQTLLFEDQLLLLCVRRAVPTPPLRYYPRSLAPAFGGPDPHGTVGEGPAAWTLRDQLAFAGSQRGHVLLLGESGAGKELAARAVHALSPRGGRPMVSRNAATLPAGLVDAELFGNVRGYPNPGMAERPGLVGESDRSTLFLDEIGELPEDLQARLLRVLDADGEYQRLGESSARRSDLRLVGATNRDPDALKHDVLARFAIRVRVPGLGERREDIPLLVHHLVRGMGDTARRFLDEGGFARVSPGLMDHLVRHEYTAHVRELAALLVLAVRDSPPPFLDLVSAVASDIRISAGEFTRWDEVTAPQIVEALARAGGNKTQAARDLGLKNREVLYRLMKKHGVAGHDVG